MSTCLATSCFFPSARAAFAGSLRALGLELTFSGVFLPHICRWVLITAMTEDCRRHTSHKTKSCDRRKPPVLFQVHPVHHPNLTSAGLRSFLRRPDVSHWSELLNCARQGIRLYSAPSMSTLSMTQSSGRTFSAILAAQYAKWTTAQTAPPTCKARRSCTTLVMGTVTFTLPLLTASGACGGRRERQPNQEQGVALGGQPSSI